MAILRFLHLLFLFGRHNCFFLLGFLNFKILFLFKYLYNPKSSKQAVRLRKFLVSAGPVFIKLAQLLATRVDIFSEEYLRELRQLRDKVPYTQYSRILKIIQAEIGAEYLDKFADISKESLASASVAQVHRATLKDGTPVIIKVIKPNTKNLFQRDIRLLKLMFRTLEIFSKQAKISKPLHLVNHLESITKLELDMRFEAAAVEEFRENFNDDKNIYIPKIYWNLTSQSVLVEEWIDGISINDMSSLQQSGIKLDSITEMLSRSFFTQVLKHGFFHGDIHQGNIIITKNKQLCFVDFGIMGRVDSKLKKYLLDLFAAFLNKDFKKAAEIHFLAGWISDKYSVEDFSLACRAIVEKVMYVPQKDIKLGELLEQLFIISTNFEMEIQENLLLLQKNFMYLENIGRTLSPQNNMWIISKKIITDIFKDENFIQQKIMSFYENLNVKARNFTNILTTQIRLIEEQNKTIKNYIFLIKFISYLMLLIMLFILWGKI